MDTQQVIMSGKLPEHGLRCLAIGVLLFLSVLPLLLSPQPTQANTDGSITETGRLVGGQTIAIPIELKQFEGIRCQVETNTGRVIIAINNPIGMPVQNFGQVSEVSYGFTAASSGTYYVVISNPSGINRVFYTLTYRIYSARDNSPEVTKYFYMNGFLQGGGQTVIYQTLTISQKIQAEILASRARVSFFCTNPVGRRSNTLTVSSHINFEIPGEVEGRYTLVIANPSGLDSAIFRLTYSVEPYTPPPPASNPAPPPSSQPPSQSVSPPPLVPPPSSARTDPPTAMTTAERNGLAFMAGVIVVVILFLLLARGRSRKGRGEYYTGDFDDRPSAGWDDYGPTSGGDINVVHHFPRRCPHCRGSGKVERPMMPINRGGLGVPRRPMMDCPHCGGTGEVLS